MEKWICTVCGYIYEGDQAPEECPVCHVGADKFKKVEGELTLAAEHEFGIYDKTDRFPLLPRSPPRSYQQLWNCSSLPAAQLKYAAV